MQTIAPLFNSFGSLVGYLIGTVVLFAWPLLAEGRAGAIDALVQSWNTVKQTFWMLLLASFIFQLIAGVGVIACCIGILFTYPLSVACIVAVYRSRFPAKGQYAA